MFTLHPTPPHPTPLHSTRLHSTRPHSTTTSRCNIEYFTAVEHSPHMRETCAHILFCHAFLLAPSHTRIPIAHCCQFRIRASDCAPLTCHASQKKSRPSQKCMRAFEPASLLCQSRHATAVTPIKEKIIGTKKTAHACGRHSRTLCSMATVHEFTMRNASAHKMRSTIASVGVKQKYRLLRRGLPQLCKTFNPLHAKKWCS